MFSFLKKVVAFLFSPKAQKAVQTAGQALDAAEKVVDQVKELQKKAPK